MKRTSQGFTIVELMVAMAIFMIICAIAIPNYMSATQRAHEAVAVSFLRQVETGEEAYRLNNQQYADTFAKLQPYIAADLVTPSFPSPGLGDAFVSVAYAEPIPVPPQGNSGSAPGQTGSTPGQGGSNPGNGGNPPGQGGSNPGNGGNPPGQGGSNPGNGGSSSGSGSTTTGSSGGSSTTTGTTTSGSTTADSKVYSMYIFQLTQTDAQHWSCTGEPIRDRLNSKFYYTDESNVIRVSVGSLADSLSPQL